MKKKLCIFLLALCPAILWAHKFYVSLAEVHRAPSGLQMSLRVFTDDLEKVLDRKITLNDTIDADIQAYLAEHMHWWVGDSLLEMQYLGKEVEYDVTYLYVEWPYAQAMNQVRLENTFLMDAFEEQSNIVNLKNRKQYVESHMFNAQKRVYQFQVDE